MRPHPIVIAIFATIAIASLVLWIALIAGWIYGCSSDPDPDKFPVTQYVRGVPVILDATGPEVCAIAAVEITLQLMQIFDPGYSDIQLIPEQGAMFIRYPEQEIPPVCKWWSFNLYCENIWNRIPDFIGIEERVPGEGLSGYENDGYIYISRIGDRANFATLLALLAHEFAHMATGWGEGQKINDLTDQIESQAEGLILNGNLQECRIEFELERRGGE